MGGSQSREGLELSDSEYSDDGEEEKEEQDSGNYADAEDRTPQVSAKVLDEVDSRLQALKLKYPKSSSPAPQKPNVGLKNAVKLYLHIGGNTPKAKWVVSEKLSSYKFVKKLKIDDEDDDEDDELDAGVWKSPEKRPVEFPERENQDLLEEFEEAATDGGIQSLALGALDNSFLVGDSGVQVVKNFSHGIHGKGVYVRFGDQKLGSSSGNSRTPKKALLMRGETNMMLMSPQKEGKPQSTGLHQLDIETGKIVTEWKFEKDGTDITMKDITSDAKGSQLDPSESTFLGLDDNRGTNFQCFATAGDGSIVIGSLDGKIRLYSEDIHESATKTAFPGLVRPLHSVDVRYDGFGHNNTYLILICTLFTVTEGGKQENIWLATVANSALYGTFSSVKNESIIESRFMHDKFALNNSPEAPLWCATPMKVTSFSMLASNCYLLNCGADEEAVEGPLKYVPDDDFISTGNKTTLNRTDILPS
ncbi:protein CYPRO4 [Sesamum angolense]|uniref:Protein CYPRO4 n=1 Tax=Sesamum angolense TaxID=2727404 RepID=A0AAE1WXS5_9LAMI|nr:protein CYPRO4 [Sesamum angolense]